MKASEIRALSDAGVAKQLEERCKELLRMNLRRKMGSVEKIHQFSSLRREIARIKTVMRAREIENARGAS
ncbi:MAG: 50S ribosomal protein L29 [Puniceicoccales bacterium]|jgi:large subunit ribosomal protein L29|nr:50S ribosomal protein L29 [Puniceicoccales bacterium]